MSSNPKTINPVVNRILDDAEERGVIKNRRDTLPMWLEMSEDSVYARTRRDPTCAWSDEQLKRIIALFSAADAYDLAGRVLRLMFPGWTVGFRQEYLGTGEPSGNIHADEAELVQDVGALLYEVANALEDNRISAVERDRISPLINRCQGALSTIADHVAVRSERADG